MNPRTLLKALTVGLFILLITAFVLYKSGYFDKKPEAGAVASATADSTKAAQLIRIDSFWMDPMMSSSKSMPVMSPHAIPHVIISEDSTPAKFSDLDSIGFDSSSFKR